MPLGSAQLNPGSIVVIDHQAGTNVRGALFRVDPTTGNRTLLSDFGNPAQGATGSAPSYVDVDASGNILVTDHFFAVREGLLFSVDPTTGVRTILSDFGDPAQGELGENPNGVAADVGNILVIDNDAGTDSRGALFNVDPATGARTIGSDFGDRTQGARGQGGLDSVAIDADGNILVTDGQFGDIFTGTFAGALYRIDPTTGRRTILSDFNYPAQGVVGCFAAGIAVETTGDFLVTDLCAGTNNQGVLFRVNPTTGARTVVSDFGNPAQGLLGRVPFDVATGASGDILVVTTQGGTDDRGVLFRINPTTGARTVVSDFGNVAQGERGNEPIGVAVVPTPPTQPVDLTIADMEITQGIQNLANDVPLVQDKTTFVRVYPAVDIVDRRVGARLRGFRGNVELPGSPLRPINPAVTVRTSGADRAFLSHTFNFWLPESWLSGNVTLRAEINPDGPVLESNTANNSLSLTRTFTAKAPVCIVTVPVRTAGVQLYRAGRGGLQFERIIDRFKSLWPTYDVWVYHLSEPVEELQCCELGLTPWYFGGYELPDDKNWVITKLVLRAYLTDDPDECEAANARTHYVGMVHPDTNTGGQHGYASYVWAASYVKMGTEAGPPNNQPFYIPRAGTVMAQELSHNYNGIPVPIISDRWLHVNCGNPPDFTDYHHPFDQIGEDGPREHWGFDPISQTVIRPTDAADYMAYCEPRWVSDFNWKGMFDELRSHGRVPAGVSALNLIDLAASPEVLLITGIIDPADDVTIIVDALRLPQENLTVGQLAKLTEATQSLTGAGGSYILEQIDASGAVLSSQAFEPGGQSERDERAFLLAVPFDPNTARLRISRNSRELDSLIVSDNPPQVRLLQPNGGELVGDSMVVEWQGSDADGDTLFYIVQYSTDLGDTWQALATGFPETRLTLETFHLPGSDGRALIRVIASDGLNTGSDTSDRPFTVPPHPPAVHIEMPTDGATFTFGEAILLSGGAGDAEDGPIPSPSLNWFIDGEVFTSGRQPIIDRLAAGTHVITLEAVDSDGRRASDSVTIHVLDRAPTGRAIKVRLEASDSPLDIAFTFNNQPFTLRSGGLALFSGLAADRYVIRETVPAGWKSLSVRCDNGFFIPQGVSPVIAVDLRENEIVECIFSVAPIASNLTLTIEDSPDPLLAGKNLTVLWKVTNQGPDNATSVALTGGLPVGTSLVSATPSRGTCSVTNGSLTCNLGNLANGATATVMVILVPPARCWVSSAAQVSGQQMDPDLTDNTALATTTVTLDDFQRSDNRLGRSWRGARDPGNYSVVNGTVEVLSSGAVYWAPTGFGPDQEACVTLAHLDLLGHHSLLLKVQRTNTGTPNWQRGTIAVFYDSRKKIGVETYLPGQGWKTLVTFHVSLHDGDQLGAQALSDGTVIVVVNGQAIGQVHSGSFFEGKGGNIGMWFISPGWPHALLDDFSAATVTP
jgi:uncharacterized repeat protein (TIGR01451 family)